MLWLDLRVDIDYQLKLARISLIFLEVQRKWK